jgi:hypothetical protein
MVIKETRIINSKKSRVVVIAILLILLMILGYFFFKPSPTEVVSKDLLPAMKDAQDRSMDEIAQKVADENYFTLTINPIAVFSNGKEAGSIEIVNSEENVYPISVSVQLKETKVEVYQSGAIYPNQEVRQGKLSVDLDKGEYEAIAIVTIYDPETEEKQGITQAELTIVVEN